MRKISHSETLLWSFTDFGSGRMKTTAKKKEKWKGKKMQKRTCFLKETSMFSEENIE